MRRFPLLYVFPVLAVLVVATAPLWSGAETLYIRDVLTSHYPLKVAQAAAMRGGELPLVDVYRAGGQPLVGNPNVLPLYPDNLLYLVASPLWALNAHFWLHLLLAPLAGFWLGRAWGLGRPAAWAVGVVYATSGFFFSLFNLYNLVAGAALTPAFVAACLDATRPAPAGSPPRRGWVWVGGLWTLLLLAGDPFFAALALLLAAGAVLARGGVPGRRPAWRVAGGLALGTLVASPMLVEMLRILPLSYRGYWRYSAGAALAQSWDPRSFLEWLLPFFFGRPDFTFWGSRFYGGNPPLLYCLYPGLLALTLVAAAGRPRGAARWWGWGAVAGGLFLATGAFNPVVRLLYLLPGASVLRYPVKFWLAVAVGGALLAGVGFERLLGGGVRRRVGWVLAALAAVELLFFALLIRFPEGFARLLRGLDPERLAGPLLERQRLDWAWLALLSLAVLGLGAAVLRVLRRRPRVGGALFLTVHVLSQCFLLQPLYDSDAAEHYTEPPAALAAVPESATVVHGGHGDLFGKLAGAPLELFPDPRFFWLARVHFDHLYPFSGIRWGRRYELDHSPEGLDSFFTVSLARALQRMPDLARVRILEASGVDLLLLDRELDRPALERVRRRALFPGDALDLYVYELPHAAPEVALPGTVLQAPHMNRALELLTAPSFDPERMVVLPGAGDGPEAEPAVERPPGTAELLRSDAEELEVAVSSPAGGVLVVQRSYLDLYRATVGGEPVPVQVADVHRLGVAVPPGEHRVRVWVDRRPYLASRAVALLALLALGAGSVWIPFARGGRELCGTGSQG